MAIWMDMTQSLREWQGGVVGIIRAELELAKNLHAIDSDIRFSVCEEGGFTEVSAQSLEWIWNTDSVADAYLEKMGRKNPMGEHGKALKQVTPRVQYAELERAYAFGDGRKDRLVHAIRLVISEFPTPLRQIVGAVGKAIYWPLYRLLRIRSRRINRRAAEALAAQAEKFSYPYQSGDVIFSCGWFTTDKERLFSKLKSRTHNISLVYLIYDIVVIKESTAQFYGYKAKFAAYIEWISNNCDFVLYGGQTAKNDAEAFFTEKNLHVPPGAFVKFPPAP